MDATSCRHKCRLLLQQPQIILLREGTDTSQGTPQLISNINACMAVVDTVRTTLGPRGMDKLVHDDRVSSRFGSWRCGVTEGRPVGRLRACWLENGSSSLWFLMQGRVTISNDGATIMKLLDIVHPAAKVLADISMSQDAEVSRQKACAFQWLSSVTVLCQICCRTVCHMCWYTGRRWHNNSCDPSRGALEGVQSLH